MRVSTWNLLHGMDVRTRRVDLAAVADGIAALDADVVAVQELDRELGRSGGTDQLTELADKLGWTGVFSPALLGEPVRNWRAVPDGADPGGPAYGIGLLSPHPLTEVHRLVLPGGAARYPTGARSVDPEPRTVLRARMSLPDGRQIVVACTHLTFVAWRAVRQLRRAVAWTASAGTPAVLLGDLNLPHRGLRPALAGTGWRAAPAAGSTFPAWRPRLQLDHVLVRGARVEAVRVAPRGPSDHRAVSGLVAIP